jgi:hypothetical protein
MIKVSVMYANTPGARFDHTDLIKARENASAASVWRRAFSLRYGTEAALTRCKPRTGARCAYDAIHFRAFSVPRRPRKKAPRNV